MGDVDTWFWFVPQQVVQTRAVVHAGKLVLCFGNTAVWVVGRAANDQVVMHSIGQVEGESWGGVGHVGNRGLVDRPGKWDGAAGSVTALDSGESRAVAVGVGQGDKGDAYGSGGYSGPDPCLVDT